MDKDWNLFEYNKARLKKLYATLCKMDNKLGFLDFQKFCISTKLIPVFFIQGYISQSQLCDMLGKIAGAIPLPKLSLAYEQFESVLKFVSVARPGSGSRYEKVKNFFMSLSTGLKINFLLSPPGKHEPISRSGSSYSLSSTNLDLNDSSTSLDLSIKEALDTLKTNKKPEESKLKISISPRPVNKVYSGSSTPKSRSIKRNTEGMRPRATMSISHSTRLLGKNSLKKENPELDEFLETEKMVQNQNLSLKVTVKSSRKPIAKPVGFSQHVALNKTSSLNKIKPSVIEINLCRQSSKNEQKGGNLQKSLEKHRNYIISSKQRNFSKELVLKIIFKAWQVFAQEGKN